MAKLPLGGRARVLELSGDEGLRQRMLELGLLPGIEVRLVRVAPLGDPLEIELLGYALSLRRSEAAQVQVEVLP